MRNPWLRGAVYCITHPRLVFVCFRGSEISVEYNKTVDKLTKIEMGKSCILKALYLGGGMKRRKRRRRERRRRANAELGFPGCAFDK